MIRSLRNRPRRLVGITLALALLTGACGGDGTTGDPTADDEDVRFSGDAEEGDPVRGGSLVYALEAETTGGWCLPEASLGISGIQIARTVYDTLTAPNEDGEITPFLAESVEPNATADIWTIALREGVTFHDGTALDAQVVANNLDAVRGAYEARNPLLLRYVFANIASVEVVDDLTLTVSTKTPWPALPWFLWYNARLGIMAQSQLDDPDTCDRELIGTGPFAMEEWIPNQRFVATRNEAYWGTDADGGQLPYLERIEYRPITQSGQRVNTLQAGEVQVMHTSQPGAIDGLRSLGDDINLLESEAFAEVSFYMLNTDEGRPFHSETARLAAAHAIDRDRLNEVRSLGIPTVASGPFAPGNTGYLDDAGYPDHDPDRARELVQQYEEEEGQGLEIELITSDDSETVANSDLLEEMLTDVGITVRRSQYDQSQLISTALAGGYDMAQWRNHPGGDPDLQYNWWSTGSPVNFSRIADPDVQDLLDRGRTETDPEVRAGIYEDLNRLLAERAYSLWQSWIVWAVGTAPEVRGILGPDLPDGSAPFTGIGAGHPVAGLWLAG